MVRALRLTVLGPFKAERVLVSRRTVRIKGGILEMSTLTQIWIVDETDREESPSYRSTRVSARTPRQPSDSEFDRYAAVVFSLAAMLLIAVGTLGYVEIRDVFSPAGSWLRGVSKTAIAISKPASTDL